MGTLSVREAFRGREVLVTGATGFLGKIWLAMLLEHAPEVGRIHLLVRGGRAPAARRFAELLRSSPAFEALRRKLGADLDDLVARRVVVHDGDVGVPELGLGPGVLAPLRERLDLVVNLAGLVDFFPDVRLALEANVSGPLALADLVGGSARAALLHVSTCYVSGRREGLIPETVEAARTPSGAPLDARAELASLRAELASTLAESGSARARRAVRSGLVALGKRRAQALGWRNTYTYTKALGEALLAERRGLALSIVRPSIVESARSYPFAGWNEGFNTTGPVAHVAGTWFRRLPARPDTPVDVVPVDDVCRALCIAGAALLRREAPPVYQVGTSHRNPVTIGRLAELTALSHRTHLRSHGASALERVVLSRFDLRAVDPASRPTLADARGLSTRLLQLARGASRRLGASDLGRVARAAARRLQDVERQLRRVEAVLEIYGPFFASTRAVFECSALRRHAVVEPELRFEPEALDWHDYWIRCHLPGLRRWCFPKDGSAPLPSDGADERALASPAEAP
jgi:long-chain acyl-CoA synthetase